MNEHEKQDEEIAGVMRESSITEMEAAARLFALQDRLPVKQTAPPRPAPKTYKVSELPALQRFAGKVKAEGPKEPPNGSWRFPVGSPNSPVAADH